MNNSGINITDATRSGQRQFVLDETPTLRDQFAMVALRELMSKSHYTAIDLLSYAKYRRQLSKKCYEIADAMMEARK